jgi:CBS domain-containing protein
MRVYDIIRFKGAKVVTIGPDALIPEAMRLMVEHNIGSLVVVEDGIAGILTERDLLRAADRDLKGLPDTTVRQLMTQIVITATPSERIQAVMETMTSHRIRHLPIVDGGELSGLISIGDVVNALREDLESENQQLHAYIEGSRL